MERFTRDGAFKERSNGNIPYAEIISFVSKVEDLMETFKIKDLETLEHCICLGKIYMDATDLKFEAVDLVEVDKCKPISIT